ncbi:DUF3768 domain-containing protein [Brucella sp. TWI432]
MNIDKSKIIAELNDKLRVTGIGGRIVLTRGIIALEQAKIEEIMLAVRSFNVFDEVNDPYADHDFGLLEAAQLPVLWKIDYYDEALSMHSPDPANPDVTVRVLTIMLADEY